MRKCISCNKCVNNCNMLKEYEVFPKDVFQGEKHYDAAMSCNICGLCKNVCPKDLYLGEVFLENRKELLRKGDRRFKSSIVFQKFTASNIFTTKKIKDKPIAFLPGCSLASGDKELLLNVKDYIEKNIGETQIIVKCCGKPAKVIGDEKTYKKVSSEYLKSIRENKFSRVITACGNCYNILKENHIEVELIWNVIVEYGVPKEKKGMYDKDNIKGIIHDPCSFRKDKDVHNNIRMILSDMGVQYSEQIYNKDKTKCCGAGGMLGMINPAYVQKSIANRVEEDTIFCYCESCKEFFCGQGKSGINILDLLFGNNENIKMNSFRRWKNRFTTKNL